MARDANWSIDSYFHEQIIKWAKQEQFNGPEINKHNPDKRCWSPEEEI